MKISQITVNGLNLISNDYSFVIGGLFDLQKDVKLNDLLIDGSAFGRSRITPKTITLSGAIKSWDSTKLAALNQALAPNGLKTISVTTDQLGTLVFQAELANRAAGKNSRLISAQLVMPDPYLYASVARAVQLGSISNASLILPAALPWTLGALAGGQGTIANLGNADAYPIITVVGTCDTISVANLTTGESISVNASLSDSDTLVIDCSAGPDNTRGIYVNGVSRLALKTTPGWIHCPPGDNLFSFSRNSLQVKQHCAVSLQSRWI